MKIDRSTLELRLLTRLNASSEFSSCGTENRNPAAVLVPFVWTDEEWHLLFTRRTSSVATHQGEISFPGGAVDPEDNSPIDTACRETFEEIGIFRDRIKILGTLDPYPTISNFCVIPVVGIVDWPVPFKLNPNEVEKLLLFPVAWLMEQRNWDEIDYTHQSGVVRKVIRYLPRDGEILWGMTAGITRIVLELI